MNLPPRDIVHVGDRERNDVQGPLEAGFHAILFTGIVDRGSHATRASAICRHLSDLPTIVSRLA
jgi:putative hydrolase of the HAD superfamily